MQEKDVPIWHKSNLTLTEAAKYFNVGMDKLRKITNDEDCNFVLWVGNKRLIKRELMDEYLKKQYSI
ncbi:excisionase family DNA-binding protein [Limosilactobacillus reuteri]|jgi:excisionase family DNA binding protein|uniref:Excisionase n=2 Tax=Lactobacillales TaxID=186826 RepID=A0A1V4FIG0_LIMRT|nr:excisionase [Limosilactobacillus reuteri]PEG89662.1 transposase [Lactobacillus sp. UMNPBX13]PEH01179.1 transposase [Lactobacillus sp. UMNPBX7]HJA91241.1 excisionase family DNA-binding protein [Candidatus Jeotgalibaca merdavium]HJF79547.1 excisionase family DNA-binding protein [Enterococcus cecorum]MCC4478539.1 excisionase family DNA-binding protein [Limosilactobacillus reuteri]